MIHRINVDEFKTYYRNLAGGKLNIFVWDVDRFFRSDMASRISHITYQHYYSLLRNGCEYDGYHKLEAKTRTITQQYELSSSRLRIDLNGCWGSGEGEDAIITP